MIEVHPPKLELFDIDARTNTDPKGFVRPVDLYRRTEFGLYMAREIVGHPTLAYVRSWLLPTLGLRVSKWSIHPGEVVHHDYYLDVVDIEPATVWRTTDLYLDLVVSTERNVRVLDTDEILAALRAGLIGDADAQRAFERTYAAVDGIAAAGYRVDHWLAGQGIAVDWRTPSDRL